MTEVAERTYTFAELSDAAKEAARSAFRSTGYPHDEWWDYVYDDAVECGQLMGIMIGKDVGPAGPTGETRKTPAINFSGFSSQGDGASFRGMYNKTDHDPVQAIVGHAPQDKVLKAIAEELALLQITTRLKNGGQLRGTINRSGYYEHSGNMRCTAYCPGVDDNGEVAQIDEKTEIELTKLMRRFADWIYTQLEAESDYLYSDECIDEQLADKTFDEDGAIV